MLGVAAALAPEPALGAEWEVTPFVGYRSDGYEVEQDLPCAGIYESCVLRGQAEDDSLFGLVVGVGLRPGWQLELLANRQDSDLRARAELIPVTSGLPAPIEIHTEIVDREVSHLQVGLARAWGQGTVRPFVGVAGGFSRVEIDAAQPGPRELALTVYLVEDSSEDAFSASAGGGVKVDLSERLGLRLEGRAFWVDLAEKAGGEFTQLDAAAGLVVRF